jgi:hypothetical protein
MEVVLNLLHRNRDDSPSGEMELPDPLQLHEPPVADCQRYDTLLKEAHHAA